MKINAERIYLRPLHVNDANGDYPTWLNDKEVCRYNSHGDTLYTKEMAIEYIKSVTNNPTCKVFAICDKKSNQHIGNISLQQISQDDKSAEFAIIMGEKEFWGKGYAKEAGEILINFGFDILKLSKIYCGTSEANIPMQRLAQKLNMKKECIKKNTTTQNNQRIDIIKYTLTKKTT